MKDFFGFDGYIFDLDGTLLDSMSLWGRVYSETLSALGVAEPADYVRAVNKMSVADGARYTVESLGLSVSPEQIVEMWKATAHKEYRDNIQPKNNAEKLLKRLAALGKSIGVATALDSSLYVPCFRRLNFDAMFRSVTTVAEVGKDKRYPDVYLVECEKMGLTPDRCAVLEDSITGATSAKRGGFYTVGVFDADADCTPQEMQAVCDRYVSDLGDLF